MGTSYTGPNNPKTYEGGDSYQYIPRNLSEDGSYIHDKEYDAANAKGALDAFFNIKLPVMKADAKLVGYNVKSSFRAKNIKELGRTVATSVGFGAILTFKGILKGFLEFGKAQINSPNKL